MTKKFFVVTESREFGLIHGMMPVSQLKQVCHRYGVSINDYLVACFGLNSADIMTKKFFVVTESK